MVTGARRIPPVPVFDVSQTEGEPLPALETAAAGAVGGLVPALVAIAGDLDVTVELLSDAAWSHGQSKGVCRWPDDEEEPPRIEVNEGLPEADLAVTLVHEYAHALLHGEGDKARGKREVEAEAVAYVVGRYLGLDVGGSAFYLAAWSEEAAAQVEERLGRISTMAKTIIEAIDIDE